MSSSLNSSSSSEPALPELRPFHEVRCTVDIVLGTASMSVRDCLALRKQAVIRLTQTAGADFAVLVNGVAVAHGEVVIVDEQTSIRVTEVVQPAGAEAQS